MDEYSYSTDCTSIMTDVKTTTPARRTNLVVGQNRGFPTTPYTSKPRSASKKGVGTHTKFVRSLIREVAGFAPYERRVMELLKNGRDKRARKLAKKRVSILL
jgi:large subunit ribosomal protein L36e